MRPTLKEFGDRIASGSRVLIKVDRFRSGKTQVWKEARFSEVFEFGLQTHRTLQSVRAAFGVRPVGVRTLFGNNRGRYGAVVSGAKISITSQATSRVLTLQSGGGGEFAVDALMPGRYKVEVQAANFKTATQDVTLEVGQVLPRP